MVGHFLQANRRSRSSLSQPANSSADLNGTANISSASTSTSSSSISSDNSGGLPTYSNFRTTRHHNATTDPSDAMSMSRSNSFQYNVNGGILSNSNSSSSVNMNGNHRQIEPGLKSNKPFEGSPSAQYMPPQNLTAEAVAALPPPGPFVKASSSQHLYAM
jgi:hypothetical protein